MGIGGGGGGGGGGRVGERGGKRRGGKWPLKKLTFFKSFFFSIVVNLEIKINLYK